MRVMLPLTAVVLLATGVYLIDPPAPEPAAPPPGGTPDTERWGEAELVANQRYVGCLDRLAHALVRGEGDLVGAGGALAAVCAGLNAAPLVRVEAAWPTGTIREKLLRTLWEAVEDVAAFEQASGHAADPAVLARLVREYQDLLASGPSAGPQDPAPDEAAGVVIVRH